MKLQINRTKKQVMAAGVALFSVFALVGVAVSANLFDPIASAQQQGMRLVTVYDRGESTSFMTAEATIGEALAASGVELDERDGVEPARDEKLIAADYQVNIYRARPVVVIEGSMRQRIVTPYQSAERIVKDAGVSLQPEDITKLTRSDDILSQGSGLQLEIIRAVPFEFDLYGSISIARTQGSTVGAMLKEKGVRLGANDRVSPSEETHISEGVHVRVWREGKQVITVDEEVAFEVEQIKDADRPIGYKDVKTPGVKGLRSATYEIIIANGVETDRKEVASISKKEPTRQVEVIGTKPEYMLYTGGGSKTEWLRASNVPQNMWGYADWLVQKESGWNPNAKNRSSGACGLAQALPCGKVSGDPHNPVNSLNWMNSYVKGRYGSWEAAVDHSKRKGWY